MSVQDKQHELIQDDPTSSKAKADRLRRVRNLANLSREAFCEGSDINLTTLISWEVGRFGGISSKGARRVISRIAKEGVFCTPEWLLFELGDGPEVKINSKKSTIQLEPQQLPEQDAIIEELNVFKKFNKHAVDFVIADDAMFPHYRIGDCVAGTMRYGKKIKSLISWDCIVQTSDGRTFMRNLQPGPNENTFNLLSTNLQTKAKDAILYDISLILAAPILWHRRKEPSL